MRVVQVGKFYYPYMGGIESHLQVLSNELKHRVDLEVLVAHRERRTRRDVVDGVRVTRCGSWGHYNSIDVTPRMALELSRLDYDVVHVHLPHPVGAASYLCSKKPHRHRLIVTYHSDVVRQRFLNQFYQPVVAELLARADVVIATSPNLKDLSRTLAPFREKCRVVPYGLDLDVFSANAEREAIAARLRARFAGRRVALGVGRLIYYKGFEQAIHALESLPDVQLVLIGDGPLRGELEALARARGVAERVSFEGELMNEAIAPYYLASDVYLLPSIAPSEAFGIVQIEAMACGVPVINTDLPSGVPFVSRHEESGLTVPPRDPQALARAVRRLLDDEPLRRRLGAAARERARAEFSKETLIRRILAAYRGEGEEADAVGTAGTAGSTGLGGAASAGRAVAGLETLG